MLPKRKRTPNISSAKAILDCILVLLISILKGIERMIYGLENITSCLSPSNASRLHT
jgi:hypothetical protein